MPDETDGAGAGAIIDPGEVGAEPAEPRTRGPDRKRRKRRVIRTDAQRAQFDAARAKRTAAASTARPKVSALDLSSLAGLLAGVHVLVAERTGVPEIAITLDEGELLMQRASAVLAHYSVETSQKALDWIALAIAVGGVYVPRAAAYAMRTSQAPDRPADDPAMARHSAVAAAQRRANGAAPAPARPAAGPSASSPAEQPTVIEVDFTNGGPEEYEA